MNKFIALPNVCEHILRLPTVVAMTGKCRTLIYAEIKTGRFPKQRKLSQRKGRTSVGWSYLEIQEYIRITLEGGEYFAS
jgi:predicted DNA-binding transcriptional regulator AlpA